MTPACCIQILDIGTQLVNSSVRNTYQRHVIFGWELVAVGHQKVKSPPVVYTKYILSFSTASPLKEDLARWLGDELTPERILRFDLKSLLGRYCLFQPFADARGETFTQSFHPLPNQADCKSLPRPVTPYGFFMAAEPDIDLLLTLPDYIQALIKASPEFIAAQNSSSI